jgi:integrase
MSGFAGLRSKEVERLDWAEVQMERGFIELKRSKSKTGQRRLVPILPNLAQWLGPYVQKSGRVWVHGTSHLSHLKQQVAEEAGIKWKHNALRHSFASYRLAQIQNANQVALETGHTVKVLFTNYRELVTPEEAKSWFEIVPNIAANRRRKDHSAARSIRQVRHKSRAINQTRIAATVPLAANNLLENDAGGVARGDAK